MVDMQQDMTDIIARNLMPSAVEVIDGVLDQSAEHGLSASQKALMTDTLDEIRNFKGLMHEDSIAATVYSYWQYFFYSSLLTDFTSGGAVESKRT